MSENNSHTERQLRDSAPTLFSIKKEEKNAPEGYFDGLEEQLISRIQDVESSDIIGIRKQNARRWAIAASIILLIGIGALLNRTDSSDNSLLTEEFQPDLTKDEDYLLAMDEDLIIETYLDEMDEIDAEQEAYIDFLMEDEIELDDLFNEI